MREGFEKFKTELGELEEAGTLKEIYKTNEDDAAGSGFESPESVAERSQQLEEIKALQRHLGIKEIEREEKIRSDGLRKNEVSPVLKISEHFFERLRRLEEKNGVEGAQEKFRVAIAAILKTGETLLNMQPKIREGKIERAVSGKVDRTEGDLASEDIILSAIRAKNPDAVILSEESRKNLTPKEKLAHEKWYVDPLDGTRSYSSNRMDFATMLAWEKGGELQFGIIFLPRRGELYYCARGAGAFLNDREVHVDKNLHLQDGFLELNQSGRGRGHRFDTKKLLPPKFSRVVMVESEGAALAALARGNASAHIASSSNPWDVAPGLLLVREAGGTVTNEKGEPFDLSRDAGDVLVASGGVEHDNLLRMLDKAASRTEMQALKQKLENAGIKVSEWGKG